MTQAHRYRLLLVDDGPNVLEPLQRVFRQENHAVTLAADASEALAAIKAAAFHWLIGDYMMPGISAGEVLRQARELVPDMIRIMLTGHADTGAVTSAIKTRAA